MNPPAHDYAELVKRYLAALQAGEAGESLARFFTADAVQTELPNRLNPQGQVSDLAAIIERSVKGLQVLRSQRFDILSIVVQGDQVAVEADWSGVLAIPLGTLPAGGTMHAHFAMFFDCADGRIHRQRNYDCFQAW